MKMKERNAQLKSALGAMATKERIQEVASMPKEDTRNIQGYKAYSLTDEFRLITMLNTLKVKDQYYRSEDKMMKELRDLIERIGLKNPYFLAQAIVYSRCMGEGMRTINQLAATLAAPFVAGTPWAKAFYGLFDKKAKQGGVIFRVDDMSAIKDAYAALNNSPLSNAMKKGFANALVNLDTYALAKYKDTVIDIANLVHPNSRLSKATVTIEGREMKTLDALMNGLTVSADTWEVAQSEAGQEVAKAVKEGKLTKQEAEKVLAEAKADNWEALLADGRLGVMAALRNIRNIMKNPRKEMIDNWCALITDAEKVRKALILPIYFDLAYDVVIKEFAQVDYSPKVQQALQDGYIASIPNLANLIPGRTCVIVDCSGSMGQGASNGKEAYRGRASYYSHEDMTDQCCYKAGLIAATIAKATGADVIKFGTSARYFSYNKNKNVFALAKEIGTDEYGGTNPGTAFDLMRNGRNAYDRIIFLSDNEANYFRPTSYFYTQYVHDVASPYIYCVDLAAYGTTPLKSDKVSYHYGYGAELYDAIANNEFQPGEHFEKIKKVVIDPNYTPTEQDLA
jgi:hypothetical protein